MSAPRFRPVCALGQRGARGDPVCFTHPDARHNAGCPAARRLARWRALEDWMMLVVLGLNVVAWGAVALLSVWARTCGLGAGCG